MKRPKLPDDEPTLFDTPPWDEEPAAEDAAPAPPSRRRRRGSAENEGHLPLPLFPELEPPAEERIPTRDSRGGVSRAAEAQPAHELAFDPIVDPIVEPGHDAAEGGWMVEETSGESESESVPVEILETEVTVGARLLAGLADLAVHGAVLVLVLLGERLLGVRWSPAQWPGLAVFLLAFSFLYTVVPLAFWGQTPGMSVVGILACTEEGENLSFPQTAARWAAALLTALLAGLPLLFAVGGVSLSDRLSTSVTRRIAG